MRHPRPLAIVATACVMSAGAALPVSAQFFHSEPVRTASGGALHIDFGARYAQPVGDFRSHVNAAWGVGGTVRHPLGRLRALGIRGDFAILNYGMERKRVPLSSTVNRVLVDMRTSNNIVVVSGGPELAVPRGPIRPYVFGFVGYSYFYTRSSVGDDDNNGSFASTTNFSDGGLATGAGGGVRIPLNTRRVRMAIDGGAHLTRSGTRTYLRRGDVLDQPDGSMTFNARTSTADFWQYHLGVSFSPR
ncbi:MAG: hypothetical protein WD801_13290 [Gemmatimonadaceae bacterium]